MGYNPTSFNPLRGTRIGGGNPDKILLSDLGLGARLPEAPQQPTGEVIAKATRVDELIFRLDGVDHFALRSGQDSHRSCLRGFTSVSLRRLEMRVSEIRRTRYSSDDEVVSTKVL